MASAPAPAGQISEVGPRDGLQSPERTMATADKCAWIDALHAAGLREIESGCFVAATRLPQRTDEAEVVRHARSLPGLTVLALVPNLGGASAAQANVRRTREQRVDEVRAIAALRAERSPQVGLEIAPRTAGAGRARCRAAARPELRRGHHRHAVRRRGGRRRGGPAYFLITCSRALSRSCAPPASACTRCST